MLKKQGGVMIKKMRLEKDVILINPCCEPFANAIASGEIDVSNGWPGTETFAFSHCPFCAKTIDIDDRED